MRDDQSSDPSDLANSTSSELLALARAQDPEAWHQLAHLYGPIVVQWCRQSCLGDQDAADVVQEVFLAVAMHLKGFRHERSGDTFRGWLRTITAHKISDQVRSRYSQPQAEGGSYAMGELARFPAVAEAIPSAADDESVKNTLVRRALDMIRPEFEDATWKAFTGMALDGRSAGEVGAELKMEAHAVRQAKYRVFRRLRQLLDGELG